ncbi:WAP four-disulfide core domain protein 10A [Bos mutus]|uniref:WAP four-disulfide core domain protein 10A n=1 Tax=Bos mutus TaxID=72004 RepID=L8IHS2_9CETA|nr:WAP four-disulfide core domain protein 10A [Bos mutus]
MRAQALLPILFLCVLLLQARGRQHSQKTNRRWWENKQLFFGLCTQVTEIKQCEKRPKIYMCKIPCSDDRECQANNICCSTFCGNICMNVL